MSVKLCMYAAMSCEKNHFQTIIELIFQFFFVCVRELYLTAGFGGNVFGMHVYNVHCTGSTEQVRVYALLTLIANVLRFTDIINLFLIYLVSRRWHTLFLLDFHIHFLCFFLLISYHRSIPFAFLRCMHLCTRLQRPIL